MPETTLKRTPLYECHVEAKARLVPFAGFEMPVQYLGVIEEHRAVRTSVGLFDVSHMGEIEVVGQASAGLRAARDVQRRVQAHTGPGPVLWADDAARDVRGRPARPQDLGRSILPRGQRVEHGQGLRVHVRPGRRLRRRGRSQPVRRLCADCDPGAAGARGAPEADTRALWRRSSTTGSWTERSTAHPPSSPAPATPGRTASRCTWLPRTPRASGGSSSTQARSSESCRSGWARATRFASKPAWRCTATTSTTRRRRSRRAWAGSSSSRRSAFLGREALVRQQAAGIKRKLVGFEMKGRGIARHGYPIWSGGERGGHRDLGDARPDAGQAPRHGLRASRAVRAGIEARHRDPRAEGRGAGGGDTVLPPPPRAWMTRGA